MRLTKNKLDEIRAKARKKKGDWIKVGMSTCGIAAGADEVFRVLKEETSKRNLGLRVEQCGCAGMCYAEPLVEVCVQGMPHVVYGGVDQNTAMEIIEKHILGKKLLNDRIYQVKGF